MSTSPATIPDERILHNLAEALNELERLLEDQDELQAIADESLLDPVALGSLLPAWIRSLTVPQMAELLNTAECPAQNTRVTTLAPGNLPIVAPECLLLGMLAGVEHHLALSSRATILAGRLLELVRRRDPELASPSHLYLWRQLSHRERSALLNTSHKVIAYGTERTLDWISSLLDKPIELLAHGPSLAVAYLDLQEPEPLSDNCLIAALKGLVTDVAAYDQRGCRSPHLLFVRGSKERVGEIAELIAYRIMPARQRELPRGQLSWSEQADFFLDKLLSSSFGEIHLTPAGTVTVEFSPTILRPSPLGRTVRVIRLQEPEELPHLLSTLEVPVGLLARIEGRTVPPLAQALELSTFGKLQSPPLSRLHDGRHRLDEFRRPTGYNLDRDLGED